MLYVNGAYRGDDELGSLMHDFCESDPDAMLNTLMAERVRYFKRTQEGEAEMCEVFDEIRQEGIELGTERGIEIGTERGIEIGVERTLLKSVARLVSGLGMSVQEAFDFLEVPEAKRPRYMAML